MAHDQDQPETPSARALADAVAAGEEEQVAALLAGGSDVDGRVVGGTVLMIAATFGYPQIVRLLLQSGAEINAADDTGMTALHWAIRYAGRAEVEALLEGGERVNEAASERGGWTPLHHAVFNEDVESVRLLLAHGAVVSAVNEDGKTPAMIARERGSDGLLKLLTETGAGTISNGLGPATPTGEESLVES